jgi:hypothetical protein
MLALEIELSALLDKLVISPIGIRPSTDENINGGIAEFMPRLRDPLVIVITAVIISVINNSGILFESEGFDYNSIILLLESVIIRENKGVDVINRVVLLRADDIITIIVICESIIILPASLLASLLESRIGLSSITLLQF